jgi:hypothetical protein
MSKEPKQQKHNIMKINTLIFISIGSKKASVLPEPVGAQAKHSLP